MGKTTLFAISLLLLATACNRRNDYETLSSRWTGFGEVYALKDAFPDIALSRFRYLTDSIGESRIEVASPFLYNEYQVLRVELDDKNGISVRNDSTMDSAFRFYESLLEQSWRRRHDEFLKYQYARSSYYKAVVESQRGMTLESFSDFLRSLEVMDELTGQLRVFPKLHQNTDYNHFTGHIYTQLASFFYRYDACFAALEVLGEANENFEKEGNTLDVADNLELMGDIMVDQLNLDVAVQFYKASDSIRTQLHDDNIYQNYSALVHNSLVLFDLGMNDSAYCMLHHALDQTENDYFARKICYFMGHFYYEEQMMDSALANYENCIPLLPRQTTRALCRVVQLSNALGDTEKAALFGGRLANNEVEQQYMAIDRTKMVSLYAQYKDDKRESRNRNLVLFILSIIVDLLLLLALDTYRLVHRRHKYMHDEEEHQLVKSRLEGQLEQNLADTRQKEKKISELEAELQRAISNPDFQKQPMKTKMDVLCQMPVCKRVFKVLDYNVKAGVSYPELALTEHHLSQLVNAVDAVFPKFSVRLIEHYPRMRRSDVMYCCLYLLGISEIQAAALTGKTYQAVWKRSTKLHEIFGNKSDLQFVLNNCLTDWY